MFKLYQTKGSNAILKEQLVLAPKHYLPIIDLLMSCLIDNNRRTKEEQCKAMNAGLAKIWEHDQFRISLSDLAKLIYPKDSVADVKKARQRWVDSTFKVCVDMVEMQNLILEMKPTAIPHTYTFKYDANWLHTIAVESIPSPLQVPAELYRFGKAGGKTVSDYAFKANRLLAVHAKMNEKGKSDFEMSTKMFCGITGIPMYEDWRAHRVRTWKEGMNMWVERCLNRSFDPYKWFKPELTGDGKFVHVTKLA